MANTVLNVYGPIDIKFDERNKIKRILEDNTFWKDHVANNLMQKQGCYIYALKVSKGFTPWYVGKATRSFKQECFVPRNVKAFNKILWEGNKGTPVMFFVSTNGVKRKISESIIKDLEKFLIQSAFINNSDLINNHHTKNLSDWGIKGVIRGGQGKPNEKSRKFKIMMGI